MAEKKIEIRIAATGGQQAAAEFEKAAAGEIKITDATRKNTEEIERNRKEFAAWQAERNAARSGSSGLATDPASIGAAPIGPARVPFSEFGGMESLDELDRRFGKVTESGKRMRFALQNAGYQIQDIAVQAEMGVPPLRILGQQLPQLAMGLGPWAVAAGAAVAVAAPLASHFLKAGEAAKQEKEELDELTKVTQKYEQAAKDAALARDVANLAEWFDALDEEERKISAINDRLSRQVELTTKLDALKRGAEAARRDLAVANIASDPTLSEADKTRQIADFREKDARDKAREEIAKLTAAATAANKAAADAQSAASDAAADVEKAAAKRAELEAEQARNAEQARIAKEQVPRLERDIAAADRAQRFMVNPETGADLPGRDDKLAEIERLKQQLAEARTASGGDLTSDERARRQERDAALLAEARSKEAEQQKQAEDARKAAEKALGESLSAQALAREGAPIITERYQVEAQARAVRTEQTAREQEKRAEEKKKQEAESEQRKKEADEKLRQAAEQRADTDAAGIGQKAKGLLGEAGKLLPRGLPEKFQRDTEAVIAGLQDGDQGGEAQKLADAMARLADAVHGRSKAMDIRFEQLEAKIKELRNPASR